MNSDENSSTNCLSSLSNLPDSPANSDVEELEPLVLGASEEVNTSTCNDDRNTTQSSKVTVNFESFHPEVLGLQRKTPLNSPLYLHKEHKLVSNMANEANGEQRLKPTEVSDFANSESVNDLKGHENGTNHNMTDTESSMITTTVVSEGISLDSARGIVVMEQVALEQINELIASASQMQGDSSDSNVEVEDPCDRRHFRSDSQNSDSSSTELDIMSRQSLQEPTVVTIDAESSDMFMSRFDDLDTKEIAEALTNELKKYSIPQAVFARKVLNRSQGTLSDVLRKPKPWNELRGGRDIFRKMKEWLDLPEVKRIPQLRTEGKTYSK